MEQQQRRDPDLRGRGRSGGHRDGPGNEPPQSFGERRSERDHPGGRRDRQLEPDRVDEPRIEHEQEQHGDREHDAGSPGPAEQHAGQRDGRHHAGAQHGGLRPGEHDEEQHGAEPQRETPGAPEADGTREREDRSEHHGDVLARHDEQVAQAGGLEGTRGDRIEPRRIPEDETEQQSIFGRREDPLDRGAHEGSHDLGKVNERVGCGA